MLIRNIFRYQCFTQYISVSMLYTIYFTINVLRNIFRYQCLHTIYFGINALRNIFRYKCFTHIFQYQCLYAMYFGINVLRNIFRYQCFTQYISVSMFYAIYFGINVLRNIFRYQCLYAIYFGINALRNIFQQKTVSLFIKGILLRFKDGNFGFTSCSTFSLEHAVHLPYIMQYIFNYKLTNNVKDIVVSPVLKVFMTIIPESDICKSF